MPSPNKPLTCSDVPHSVGGCALGGDGGAYADTPPVATEWTVEARPGGTCLVRVVHSWFASTDDWDGQYEDMEYGWAAFFRILRLYLSAFRDQPCTAIQLMAFTPQSVTKAWATLTEPLGLPAALKGQQVDSRCRWDLVSVCRSGSIYLVIRLRPWPRAKNHSGRHGSMSASPDRLGHAPDVHHRVTAPWPPRL
jgi:hypothetical protein